jgi:hypothetical protein
MYIAEASAYSLKSYEVEIAGQDSRDDAFKPKDVLENRLATAFVKSRRARFLLSALGLPVPGHWASVRYTDQSRGNGGPLIP